MLFTVYALASIDHKYRYIGMTNNLSRRIKEHSKGYESTTKPYRPFKLVYTKSFTTRLLARNHEKWLKSGVGREFLDELEI